MNMVAFTLHRDGLATEAEDRFELSDRTKPAFAFSTFCISNQSDHVRVSSLSRHFARVLNTVKALNLNLDFAAHEDSYFKALRKSLGSHNLPLGKLRVRLQVSGSKVVVHLEAFSHRWQNTAFLKCITFQATRELALYKTNACKTSLDASEHARQQGCDEAILVDDNGVITEGAWSNIFWVEDESRIYTTDRVVLPGIAREILLENFDIKAKAVTTEELFESASAVFLTQHCSGITPVGVINQKAISQDSLPFVKSIARRYESAIERESETISKS